MSTKGQAVLKARYMVQLSCFHVMIYPSPAPPPGTEVYCRKCADYRYTMSAELEWSVRCRNCHLSRSYGADSGKAHEVASAHVVRFNTHHAQVIQGVDVKKVYKMTPGTNSIIEWNRTHPDHARSLKTLPNRDLSRSADHGVSR